MSLHPTERGAAAVGQLHAIDHWQALLVRHLRFWCEGPATRNDVRRFWQEHAHPAAGQETLARFDALVQQFLSCARRPLVRHGTGCDCLGADEAVFLQIVTDASEGRLDDAVMLSGYILMPAHAEHVALLAGQVGIDFRTGVSGQMEQSRMRTSAMPYVNH